MALPHALFCSTTRSLHVQRACFPRASSSASTTTDTTSTSATRTQKIMEKLATSIEAGGAGGASSYAALKRVDEQWLRIRTAESRKDLVSDVVTRKPGIYQEGVAKTDVFDAVICGGTLGVFVAAALAIKGFKVAIVERGKLQGRTQEWNISRKELNELVKLGILTHENFPEVISAEFNPNRCGFNGRVEVWVKDILNLGVRPSRLIELVKQKFLSLGGVIYEDSGLSKADVFDDAVVFTLSNNEKLFSRLLIDAMGNFSPIVTQLRKGKKPDGMCLVVGTCAKGFEKNSTSDIIYTNSPPNKVGKKKLQLFWEAFPAGSGPQDRTCYLFSYMDIEPQCPSLEEMLEAYWDLMPKYQTTQLEDLEVLRVLFGIFPTYRLSPLPAGFDRVLQVGDASGIQSPVSFGGFGSITRHLKRIADGISESLEADLLDKDSLALLNPYMPNLSASWLFQKAMSAQGESLENMDFINTLLATNFRSMQKLGDQVLRPFLQDVIQFGPLARTLGYVVLIRPDLLPSIFKQVGVKPILGFMVHFSRLGWYTLLSLFVSPRIKPWVSRLPKREQYVWRRRLDAWEYGSGLDYNFEE